MRMSHFLPFDLKETEKKTHGNCILLCSFHSQSVPSASSAAERMLQPQETEHVVPKMPMLTVLPVDVDFGYCREKIKLTGNE